MKKILSMLILFALVCFGTLTAQADDLTLTLMNSDWTTQNVPVDGYNLDGNQHNQLLFLSNELSAMDGSNIKGLKFYFNKTGHSWSDASKIPTVTFRLAEVENTTLSSQVTVDESFTQVYSGEINFSFSEKEWSITFDAPYSYKGGNLLIDIQTEKNGSTYVRNSGSNYMKFYADDVTGRALKGLTAQSYCPKTTFTYEEAVDPNACNKPKNLAISAELPDGATFTWEQNADETVYQWACVTSGAEVETWNTLDADVRTKTVEGLTAGTAYDFYVRSYCGEGENEQSDPVKQTFTPTCPAPTFGANPVTAKAATTATIEWNAADGISKYQYICVAKNATPNWEEAKEATTTSASVIDLSAYTEYDFYVRSWYSATSISAAVKTTFRTECAAVNAPYAWDFEGETVSTVPGCWDNSGSATTTASGSDSHYVWGVYSYNSYKTIRLYNSFVKAGTALINTPSIVLPASPAQELTFKYSHRASCGDFTVKVSTDGGASFTDLQSYSRTAANSTYDPGSFEEATISLADYAGNTIILQFFATADYDAGAIFVDNVDIHNAASCAKPSAVTATATSYSTASVAWKNGGEETAWKIRYSTDGENWTIVPADANPFELTELSENTTYQVQVQADCGEDQSLWVASAEPLETPCKPKTIPFSENFESALSACWSVGSKWSLSANDKYNGTQSMHFVTDANSDLQLPIIALPTENAQLTFFHKNASATAAVYLNEVTTENKLADIKTSSEWKQDTIDLSAHKSENVTLIFHGINNSWYTYHFYLDSVLVSYKPVAKPTDLTVTPGNATATITWESEEGTSWNLQYRVVGADAWTTVEGIETKTYMLEDLTNGTTYEAQVQAVCSANRKSEWTASANFTPVACPSVTEITFGARTYNSIVVNWETSGAGTWNLDFRQGESDWSERHGRTEQTETLTGLATGVEYTVVVYPTCNAEAAVQAKFTLGYSDPVVAEAENITDEGATVSWVHFGDATGYQYAVVLHDTDVDWDNATATTEKSAIINGLQANTHYDFVARATYPTGVSGNDTIDFTTVTVAPKNFTQVALGATTATYSWEKDGANTTFEYSLDGEAWTDVATNQVELKGLTGNTAYTLYVRSVYDGELRSANASVSFRTECAAVSALTWTDGNFENETAGNAPRCWTIYSPNAYPYVNTWYPHAGSKQHLWFQDGGKAGAEQIAALPEFTEDIKTLKMSFYYHNNGYTSSSYPSLEVGVMSDVNDSASFRTLFVLDKTSSYATNPTEVLFNGATASEKYIAFRLAGGTYNGRATIDDITFSAAPTCFAPVLAEPTILPDGATFTWTAGNGEEHFQYAIDTTETLVWTATDETTVTVHGFAPGTQRKFYVRAFCNPEVSESVWTAFTPECPAPAKVDTVDGTLTTNAVSIHWTAAAGITNYQYSVVAKNASADWTKAVLVENATTAELSGLSASTEYTVYVRSYYSAISQSSAVSVNFATECAAIAELNENFSEKATGALPLCWDAEGASSYVTIASSGYSAFDGNGLYFTGSTNYVYVLLPEFSVALNTMQISFKHNVEDTGKSGRVELGYYKEGAFTQIKECEETAAKTWVNEGPIALTAVPAGARIAFAYKATTSTYTAVVDNIKVEAIPSCAVPTDLAISEKTDATAKVTWNSDAEGFALQYKADGDENWTNAAGEIASPFTLTGLTPQTTYQVQVKAVCDKANEIESAWTEPVEFTTECEAVNMLDEDFSTGVPECWKTTGTWNTDSWTYGSAAPSLKYNATGAGEITTVAVNVTKEEAVLQFNIQNVYNGSNYRAGRVIVKAAEVEDFSTDFINSKDIANVQVIDLAAYYGKTITITFQVDALGSTKAVYIDDVKVIVKPCDTPKNLNATASLDSVVLVWEQGGDETTYQYSVVKKGAEADWKTLDDGVRTVTVKNLLTDTLYTASVRSYCGETRVGETVLTADFTPLCPQPSDIAITNITANGVKASWTPAEGIAKYQWSLVEDEWLEANIVEATSVDLGGLEAATDYTLYVRSYFSATSVSAPISQAFTTACDIYGMPFAQNFDALVSGIPTCWDNSEGTTTYASYKWNYYANGRDGACVRFESYSNNDGNTNVLVTPSIVISSENPALSFYFKNPDGGAYTVEINDGTSTNVLVGEGMTGIGEWTQKVVELDAYQGKTVTFRFCGTSNSAPYGSDGYLYLDDVLVDKKSDIPTAINFVGADDAKVIKLIENDQLVIIRDGIKYNAQGKRLGE